MHITYNDDRGGDSFQIRLLHEYLLNFLANAFDLPFRQRLLGFDLLEKSLVVHKKYKIGVL